MAMMKEEDLASRTKRTTTTAKRAELSITLLNGEAYTTKVKVVGDLALGETKSGKPNVWHVPSRTSFHKALPEGLLTKPEKKVLEWMAKVQQDLKHDWKKLQDVSAMDVATDPDRSKELRGRIRNHCLGTKI